MTMKSLCCEGCFEDPPIKAHIRSFSKNGECDFCGATTGAVIRVKQLMPFIDEGIDRAYEPSSAYEGSNFTLDSFSLREVLRVRGIVAGMESRSRALLDALCSASRRQYRLVLRNNPYGDQVQGRDAYENWVTFRESVMKRRRFTQFLETKSRNKAGKIFDDIMKQWFQIELPSTLKTRFKELPRDTSIFRARILNREERVCPKKMTSPPPDKARDGRMNPRGISYFYGAETPVTAEAEVRSKRHDDIVRVAEFRTAKELTILDLVDLPSAKSSIFASNYQYYSEVGDLLFLRDFAKSISCPVSNTDNPIEYIPTQALCEWLHYRVLSDEPVHGIRYESAVADGVNLALFRGPDISLAPKPRRWLKYCRVLRA